jgi:hypothetical protein
MDLFGAKKVLALELQVLPRARLMALAEPISPAHAALLSKHVMPWYSFLEAHAERRPQDMFW